MARFYSFIVSAIVGFIVLDYITHPHSAFNKKLPKISLKFLQISPWMQLRVKGRIIHIHHWMNLSLLLVISLTIGGGILDATYTKGILLGGIIQGLTLGDWKKIIHINKSPSTLRSGYLLPSLRREKNPSEAKFSSLSSPIKSGYFAKGDK